MSLDSPHRPSYPPSERGQREVFLATKLYVPAPRPGLVSRPHLIERLEQVAQYKLTLLAAPAGFGKTTLLGAWVDHLDREVALPAGWVSLDAGDNDPTRFWAYVAAALEQVHAGAGQSALALLRSPQPVPVESVLATLINQVAAIPRDFVLVLDDYQVIETAMIHEALSSLLDHAPPQMHLVIASRQDPPLPLALLRARGELCELRVADLRFTPEEALSFLEGAVGVDLPEEVGTALAERTEGWAAGLQLAAVALRSLLSTQQPRFPDDLPPPAPFPQTAPAISNFVQELSDHRYVWDYLAQEVLQRQPEEVRHFLLRTSILDRLSGPLCDAVCYGGVAAGTIDQQGEGRRPAGPSAGQAMLAWLDRNNLFLVALDGERHWYRYHHLFGDFLRARLQQGHPAWVPQLHRRAAAWYEGQGMETEAVQHALTVGDLPWAAALIERAAPTVLWERGEVTTFLGWLDRLPEALVCERPRLCLAQAWTLSFTGAFDRAKSRLEQVETAAEAAADAEAIRTELMSIRALLTAFEGDMPRTVALCERALERIPEERAFLHSALAGALGAAYLAMDQVAAARRRFAQSSHLTLTTGSLSVALISLSFLGQTEVLLGQLKQAGRTYRRALQLVSERNVQALPATGMAHVGLGALLCEWNELEEAATHLTMGVEQCRQWAGMGVQPAGLFLIDGHMALSRLLQARGEGAEALQSIDQAEDLVLELNLVHHLSTLAAQRARLWLAQGNLGAAADWAGRSGLRLDDSPNPPQTFEYATLIRLRIAQGPIHAPEGNWPDLLALLEQLQQMAEQAGRRGDLIELLVLRALAHRARGQADLAKEDLGQALTLAQPAGYVRLFVDEGAPLEALLRRAASQCAASQGLVGTYTSQLLAAVAAEPASTPAAQPLAEPLTERELEVLRWIAAGLSNREIAEELVIALGTAKKHVSNLYGKLGVHSRTQAVARARELGLLAR